MSKLKVYISSTFRDMEDVRSHIIDRIRVGLTDNFELSKVMEMMHGDLLNRPNIDFCLDEVRNADLYIILVGNRYGSHTDYYHNEENIKTQNTDCLSYTELEYVTAEATLEKRLYGIYKFHITEDFFKENNLDCHTDLSDINIKEKHACFLNKLSEKNILIKIDSNQKLIAEINNKLTEFNLYYNNLFKLEINDYQKTLINRQNQVNIINQKKNPGNILDKKLGQYSRCVVMIVNTIGEKDYYDGFNLRLKTEIINSTDTITFKVGDIMNRLASCSIDNENQYNRIFEVLLEACSNSILGNPGTNLNFDNLYREIIDKRVQNRFISLDIETDYENEIMNQRCFEIITQFIHKLENILSSNNFVYNFYFVINLKEEDLSDDIIEKYHNRLNQQLTNIECINLNKLKLIEYDDVIAWLNPIVSKSGINKTTEDVYKFIFLKNNEQPRYYKDYIEQLEKRTRIWNT